MGPFFAACFASSACHGGAALRARLICSWEGVHTFLLVWSLVRRWKPRTLLVHESGGDFVSIRGSSERVLFIRSFGCVLFQADFAGMKRDAFSLRLFLFGSVREHV